MHAVDSHLLQHGKLSDTAASAATFTGEASFFPTCPRRMVPSPSFRLTISANIGFCSGRNHTSSQAMQTEGAWPIGKPVAVMQQVGGTAYKLAASKRALTCSTMTNGPLTPPTVR